MHPNSLPTLPEATVQQRLSEELPHWTLEGGWIRRKYRTSGWKASLILVNTIGHLAEVAWHHPDLSVTYAMVIVKLMTHSAKGITERDLALAKKIEEVIQWQPREEHPGVLILAWRQYPTKKSLGRPCRLITEHFNSLD
ncbi:MAG: 4a-hydroxytetrahydrobiopterin dehydratase [Gammaproteobacteria bacterium]|nr:4a-hydroxytetrahydrobiopterin dehydratase [Gammaproteobacteria bacterium]